MPEESHNINDTFFDGHYKDIWKAIIPDILTEREINFLFNYFELQPGQHVLDLMCGYGRHSLALARRGVQVTAVDNLPSYINEIRQKVEEEKLSVQTVLASAAKFAPAAKFDLAMCMGNSLNFFDAKDTASIFSMASSSLKEGGHLLINSWSVAEIVFRSFKEESQQDVDGKNFAVKNKLLFHPTRLETESFITDSDGVVEKKIAIDYIFSINEMEKMLHSAGLKIKQLFSIPGKKPFAIGEPRLYLVAEKS